MGDAIGEKFEETQTRQKQNGSLLDRDCYEDYRQPRRVDLHTKQTQSASERAAADARVQDWIDRFDDYPQSSNAYPRALSARLACLGLAGRFHIDNNILEKELLKCGSLGKQLVSKMTGMLSDKWDIGPYKNNLAEMFQMTGGHCDESLRQIRYSPTLSKLFGTVVGASIGDPVKFAAGTLAHEISHNDGIGGWSDKQLLKTESRAFFVESAVSQKLKVLATNAELVGRGDLGSYIYDSYLKKDSSRMTRREASLFVKDYLHEAFGKELVDRSGRIKPFALHAGLNDFPSLAMEDFAHVPVKTGGRIALRSILVNGSAALAGLVGIATMADLNGAFSESTGKGCGRLVRTAFDYGAMEVGSILGSLITGKLSITAKYGASLVGTVLVSSYADKTFGLQVEKVTKNGVDNLSREYQQRI